MKKELKQQLETVITSLINDQPKAAQTALHDYLRVKSQEILGEHDDMDDMEHENNDEDNHDDDVDDKSPDRHEPDEDHDEDEDDVCPECGEDPCVCDEEDMDHDEHDEDKK